MTRRQFSGLSAGTLMSAAASRGQQGRREFFYRPEGAWAADFIPFYSHGEFRLFYLLDWRDKEGRGEGTPWYQIGTKDFVHFTEYGEMLARGSQRDQDLYVFTGSVTAADNRFHIFYTGHNPHFRQAGRPVQGIMHAVSDDLLHWKKLPEDAFFAPSDRFEADDWRDPFVFWNEDAGEYWMLVAARLKSGPSRRRGCTGLCVSKDLRRWEVREPFWAPGLYFTHECPDLFRMGNWWYLVFSEFSERTLTRYRMSRSLKGPWLVPENDSFDGRAFYAAKTAADGERRFVFGWNPTRDGGKDYAKWNWGGNLVVHEIAQNADGTLSVKVPDTVDRAFGRAKRFDLRNSIGDPAMAGNEVQLAAHDGFTCAAAGPMPERCKIRMSVKFEPGTRGCGVMLRASDDVESAYYVRIEPEKNRIVFDSWPRPGDIPFMVELERPIHVDPGGAVDLRIFVDGSVCVVYASDRVAMSTRLYNLKQGNWGVFVEEGAAHFGSIALNT